MDIFISVIVPIYNVKPFLEECLESLRRQSYTHFEAILINDGSTDGSEVIAENFCHKDRRFKLFKQRNQGLSVARNTGLKKASGDYVLFLDSDDYLMDKALSELNSFCSGKTFDVVLYGAESFIDGEQRKEAKSVPITSKSYRYEYEYPKGCSGQELITILLDNKETNVSACMMMINRKFLDEKKVFFRPGILHEDNLFFFQLMTVAKNTAVLNKELYCRRIREGSITRSSNHGKKIRSLYLISRDIEKILYTHPEIKEQLPYWRVLKRLAIEIVEIYTNLPEEEMNDRREQFFYGMTHVWLERRGYTEGWLIRRNYPVYVESQDFYNKLWDAEECFGHWIYEHKKRKLKKNLHV